MNLTINIPVIPPSLRKAFLNLPVISQLLSTLTTPIGQLEWEISGNEPSRRFAGESLSSAIASENYREIAPFLGRQLLVEGGAAFERQAYLTLGKSRPHFFCIWGVDVGTLLLNDRWDEEVNKEEPRYFQKTSNQEFTPLSDTNLAVFALYDPSIPYFESISLLLSPIDLVLSAIADSLGISVIWLPLSSVAGIEASELKEVLPTFEGMKQVVLPLIKQGSGAHQSKLFLELTGHPGSSPNIGGYSEWLLDLVIEGLYYATARFISFLCENYHQRSAIGSQVEYNDSRLTHILIALTLAIRIAIEIELLAFYHPASRLQFNFTYRK